MQAFLAITKALSDENRVRAVMMLRGGEMCVCQIIEMLGLAPSTVSKHMSILKQAGLVQSRKQGRWIYYRLADDYPDTQIQESLAWLMRCLTKDSQIRQDKNRLPKVMAIDPEMLCRRQFER